MISYHEAYKLVLNSSIDFGHERVNIKNCLGRVLAEEIVADRDFPPFDRVTKDGIALKFEALKHTKILDIQEVAAAGEAQKTLENPENCIEVMTGAMLPKNTDTVVMYEDLKIDGGKAKINFQPEKGQNIHTKGADQSKSSLLINRGERIGTQSIGIIATVGKSEILVKKLPKIAIISTGNELVPVEEKPEIHQIRSSNSLTLKSLLTKEKISSKCFHIKDNKEQIASKLTDILQNFDVVLLSGGVSMGKFDYLPEVLGETGVSKIFHRVAQRPGKPFWFGHHPNFKTTVFSFPGNPNSTFINYHLYFLDWLNTCLGVVVQQKSVMSLEDVKGLEGLHSFPLVNVKNEDGMLKAKKIITNGSGDMVSLLKADGVLSIPQNISIKSGDVVQFISF